MLVGSGTFWHRYYQQISDKHGQHTGKRRKRRLILSMVSHILLPYPAVMKTTCRSKLFYSYHYILCIYLSINNHCLESATFDPLHRHCSSENSVTYWWSFFPSSYIWGIVLQNIINKAREITRIKDSPHIPIVRKMPERLGSTV